ncbi:hypothetical protein FBQ87_11860 [Sphingobacteriales bacterium CHB3]|nr:hypothetical protein [Sphingobacteriales bacterium CHB3]
MSVIACPAVKGPLGVVITAPCPSIATIKLIGGKLMAGCAAGLATNTGSIGYLGPLINDETRRLAASAYLGARYCYEHYKGGNPADLTFIPPINGASWTNVADPNHTFDFNADSANINVNTGVFAGTETLNSIVSSLTGSFNNRTISINIQRPSGAIRFDGQFVSNSLIDFGSFRISR